MKRIVLAISGASGGRYGMRLLQVAHELGLEVVLLVSEGGARVLEIEEGVRVDPERPDPRRLLGLEGEGPVPGIRPEALSDIAATICSGSHPVDGMVVAPCSMGTLARIAQGTSSNAIERGADVMLKEGRPLVLVPRETPHSRIHLENMLRVHDAGAAILPASPGFYHRPKTIADLVDQVVGKILDRLGVDHALVRRWKTAGTPAERSPARDPGEA